MASRKQVATYMCSRVIMSFGYHEVSGFASDSFITIEKNGDGVTSEQGVDGEVARSIDPVTTYKVKISLMQTSDSNKFFEEQYKMDQETGEGIAPILIKDITGNTLFQAAESWVMKPTSRSYGKATANRDWEFETGDGEITQQ